jgi:hypothetical protein
MGLEPKIAFILEAKMAFIIGIFLEFFYHTSLYDYVLFLTLLFIAYFAFKHGNFMTEFDEKLFKKHMQDLENEAIILKRKKDWHYLCLRALTLFGLIIDWSLLTLLLYIPLHFIKKFW